jgi:hypothetical protein
MGRNETHFRNPEYQPSQHAIWRQTQGKTEFITSSNADGNGTPTSVLKPGEECVVKRKIEAARTGDATSRTCISHARALSPKKCSSSPIEEPRQVRSCVASENIELVRLTVAVNFCVFAPISL